MASTIYVFATTQRNQTKSIRYLNNATCLKLTEHKTESTDFKDKVDLLVVSLGGGKLLTPPTNLDLITYRSLYF